MNKLTTNKCEEARQSGQIIRCRAKILNGDLKKSRLSLIKQKRREARGPFPEKGRHSGLWIPRESTTDIPEINSPTKISLKQAVILRIEIVVNKNAARCFFVIEEEGNLRIK